MTLNEIKEIQQVQLKIMDDIHRICVEHGLKYYMIGGTALGSIRHNGFIPWDVDIDIAMPRKDYELFVTKYSSELTSGFSCHDYRTDKKHFSPHAIIAMDNSTVLFSFSQKNPGLTFGGYGLYVDLLPLDQVPDSKEMRALHEAKLRRIHTWRRLKSCEIYSTNTWFKAKVKQLVSILIPIPLYNINKKQQEIAQMYNYLPSSESHDICSTLSHYKYNKLCMPKTVWGEPKLYKFEGREYYGQENIKEYLTLLFGDYMRLPSEKQQRASMNMLKYVEWIDENGIHSVGEK